jgi:hypothetical protein
MPELLDRLLARTRLIPESGCRLWVGPTTPQGYGMIRKRTSRIATHRLAWTLKHGPIPQGLWICHRCDTPPCINPDHLFLGTPAENCQDSIAKGRNENKNKTHCPRGHAFAGDNVFAVANGRWCRQCTRIDRKEYYKHNKEKVNASTSRSRKERQKKKDASHAD